MSSAIRLQEFLSIIDPGLFFCIKSIRRALEVLQFDWVITGHLAINLYAYLAGLQPMPTKILVSDIYINRFSKSDLVIEGELKALVSYLEQLGFVSDNSSLEFTHPYSTTRFKLNISSDPSLFDNRYRVWMRNRLGKATYPLLSPARLERQQLRQISYLSVKKKNVEKAADLISYPLVDVYQNGIGCYLSLTIPTSEETQLIAPPMLLLSEREIGMSIYQWTKYVLSESLISTDEISLPAKKNRITKKLVITPPQPVQIEEPPKPAVLDMLEESTPTGDEFVFDEKPAPSQKEQQLQLIRDRAKRIQKTR
jgi:hypothetical protein